MRVETNIEKLGDNNPKYLSGVEALEHALEEDALALRKFKLDDQENMANVEARLGSPMDWRQLVGRVRRLTHRKVWYEDSINWPGGGNFYTLRDNIKVCLNAAFERGALPEFSYVLEDNRGLPCKEGRGWRTVLYRLMASKAITKEQIRQEFGLPYGDQAKRWQMFTRDY